MPIRNKKSRRYTCELCDAIDNAMMIQCDACQLRYHLKCLNLESIHVDDVWTCLACEEKANVNKTQGTDNSKRTESQNQQSKTKSSGSRRAQIELSRIEEERILKEKRDKEYLDSKYKVLLDNRSEKFSRSILEKQETDRSGCTQQKDGSKSADVSQFPLTFKRKESRTNNEAAQQFTKAISNIDFDKTSSPDPPLQSITTTRRKAVQPEGEHHTCSAKIGKNQNKFYRDRSPYPVQNAMQQMFQERTSQHYDNVGAPSSNSKIVVSPNAPTRQKQMSSTGRLMDKQQKDPILKDQIARRFVEWKRGKESSHQSDQADQSYDKVNGGYVGKPVMSSTSEIHHAYNIEATFMQTGNTPSIEWDNFVEPRNDKENSHTDLVMSRLKSYFVEVKSKPKFRSEGSQEREERRSYATSSTSVDDDVNKGSSVEFVSLLKPNKSQSERRVELKRPENNFQNWTSTSNGSSKSNQNVEFPKDVAESQPIIPYTNHQSNQKIGLQDSGNDGTNSQERENRRSNVGSHPIIDNCRPNKTSNPQTQTTENITANQIASIHVTKEKLIAQYPYLRNIPYVSYSNAILGIMVGSDKPKYGTQLQVEESVEVETNGFNGPRATRTHFGWSLHGPRESSTSIEHVNLHQLEKCPHQNESDIEIHQRVKWFFSVDNFGVQANWKLNLNSKNDERALEMLDKLTRTVKGKHETGLLHRSDKIDLPDSYPVALKGLVSTQRHGPDMVRTIGAKVAGYAVKGHARKLTPTESKYNDPVWYPPLFGVIHPKRPGKIRMVFAATAKKRKIYSQFVAHRVGEIVENSDVNEWLLIPTVNVAEKATKWTKTPDLEHSNRWEPLQLQELCITENLIVRQAQFEEYPQEMGRTDGALDISMRHKRHIVLPKSSRITRLILSEFQSRFYHQNYETVINEIHPKFYVPHLREVLKKVRKECQNCEINKAHTVPPQMTNLPQARLATRFIPFSFVGIGFFGPMYDFVGRSREKKCNVLFTCLTMRADYIEIASGLDTNSCILCIQNFVDHGPVIEFHSDWGINFKGSNNELQDEIKKIEPENLHTEFTSTYTKRIFNAPASPHMDGSWKRLIRSVKSSIDEIISSRTPKENMLRNWMKQIQNVINSRPLTYIPLDVEKDEALTLNLFLKLSSKPPCKIELDGTYLRRSWKESQRLTELFWKRFVRENLPTITKRSKWHKKVEPLKTGDLVLVVDEKSPRNTYPKARILRTVVGSNNQVRRAEVELIAGTRSNANGQICQVKKTKLWRSSHKLALLDVASKDGLAIPGSDSKTGGSVAATDFESNNPLMDNTDHIEATGSLDRSMT